MSACGFFIHAWELWCSVGRDIRQHIQALQDSRIDVAFFTSAETLTMYLTEKGNSGNHWTLMKPI